MAKFVVGNGLDDGVTMGPVVSAASKERILEALAEAEKLGATFALDGRTVKPSGGAETEKGYFIGPTVVTGLDPAH